MISDVHLALAAYQWCSSVGRLPIRQHLKLALSSIKHGAWLDLPEQQ
jgi:hypothetical protein